VSDAGYRVGDGGQVVRHLLVRALRLLYKSPRDFAMALWMVALMAASTALVRLTSVPHALRLLVKSAKAARPLSPGKIEGQVALLDAVVHVLKRNAGFLSPTCWERAIVLQRLLAASGVSTDVALGVRQALRGCVEGHAWVEREGRPMFEPIELSYRKMVLFSAPRRDALSAAWVSRARGACVFLALLLVAADLRAGPGADAAKPAYKLNVSKGVVTLMSKGALARDVLADLSKRLKVPIRFSAKTGALRLSANWEKVPLETVLAYLSPRVFVDLVFDGSNPEGRYMQIHLAGLDEPDPAKPSDLAGLMIIRGNTETEEDGPLTGPTPAPPAPEDPNEPFLRVNVENDRVSVKARRQTVAAILAQVAVLVSAPLVTRGALDSELIDLDFNGAAPEELPALIARPSVAVLVRRDLGNNVSRLLEVRFGVVKP